MKSTPFYTRLAHVLISIICLFYIAIIGQTVLAPLLFALLFSLLLLPFANFLEQKFRLPRALSSIAVLVVLSTCILGVIMLLLSQLTDLSDDFPAFKQQLLIATESIQDWISNTFKINNSQQVDYINTATSDALSQGGTLIGHTILSISSLMLSLVFIFLYTFCILVYRKLLLRFAISLFSEEHTVIVYDVVAQIRYIVKKYIAGLFIQMLVVTLLSCIAFEVIGIKYAILLGLITGIFNIIPYIGIFTSLLITVLITFATMGNTEVLFVVLSVTGIHLVDGNYIMPKVVGSKVRINTFAALIGLVIGELVWGIKGMFLSIPILAICKIIFDRVEGLRPWGIILGEEEEIAPSTLEIVTTPEKKQLKDELE